MKSMDIKNDEEDLAVILLYSLPSSYDNLVDTILYGRDTLTLEEVKAALVSREMKSEEAIIHRLLEISHEIRTV